MTIQEWRSNQQLANELDILLRNPVLVAAMSVLDSLSPAKQSIAAQADSAALTNPSLVLGNIQGYELYAAKLRDLAKAVEKPRQPREDYASKDTQPDQ